MSEKKEKAGEGGEGAREGGKVREELSPGIKISGFPFFSLFPPATFQLFLKYLAMSISK